MKTNEKKTTKKCYECGKDLTGKAGRDFHVIKSRYGSRNYCLECIERIRNL